MISQVLSNSCLAVILVAGAVIVAPASCSAASSESASISSVVSSTSSTHGQRSLTIHRLLLNQFQRLLRLVLSILKVYCLLRLTCMTSELFRLNSVLGCTIAYGTHDLFLFCLGEAIDSASTASMDSITSPRYFPNSLLLNRVKLNYCPIALTA